MFFNTDAKRPFCHIMSLKLKAKCSLASRQERLKGFRFLKNNLEELLLPKSPYKYFISIRDLSV